MSTQLAFDILARDRGASATFDRVGDRVDRTSSRFRHLGSAVKFAALGLAGGVAVAGKAALDLAKGAAEDEKATRAMALQFRNSADATREQVKATEAWISTQGTSLGITDDELRPALSKLVAVTHDVAEARKLASIAEDVAAGRGKSLATVTDALAKAQLGSLGGLSRLGVQTKDAEGKTLSLQQVTKNLAETYQGQAAKAADTASGRYQRLQVILSETGEAIGYKLLPVAGDFADWLLEDGVPALEQMSQWLQTNTTDAVDAGKALARDLIPAVKDGAEVVLDLVNVGAQAIKWFDQLPGPIKSVGAEVAIAALVMPRLTGGLQTNSQALGQWMTQLRSSETRAGAVSGAVERLGSAARNAAGIGGMVLLAQGANEANQSLGFLEKTAGGALLGFSVGGPWGGAIGAGAGALYGLATATGESAVQMVGAKDAAKAYARSLDQTTASATGLTRSLVMDTITKRLGDSLPYVNQALRETGLSMRDLVGYATGEAAATTRLNQAIRENANSRDETKRVAAEQLRLQRDMLDGDREEFQAGQERVRQLQSWRDALLGFPKGVKVALKQEGYAPSMRQIQALGKQYDLTPRQIRTLIRITGAEQTESVAKHARRALEDVGNAKPSRKWADLFSVDMRKAQAAATTGSSGIGRTIQTSSGRWRPDMGPFLNALNRGNDKAKGIAGVGGQQIGDALQRGVITGFAGTQAELSSQAAAAVRAAINAAKAEGKIKSPSQVMRDEVGRMLGRGLTLGVEDEFDATQAAGSQMMRRLADGVEDGSKSLQNRLDAATGTLAKWRDRLGSLLEESRSYASGFQSFATSIFAADLQGTTATSASGGVTSTPASLEDLFFFAQNQQDRAGSLRNNVQRLIALGLSPALLKQLQSQGASGAQMISLLATANRGQIQRFNAMNAQTTQSLQQAGMAGAERIWGGSIREARREIKVAIDEKKLAAAIVDAIEDRRQRDREKPQRVHMDAESAEAIGGAVGRALGDVSNRVGRGR